MAVIIQAESGRDPNGPSRRQIPRHARSEVVGCFMQTQGSRFAETAVYLDSHNEILATESAIPRGCPEFQKAADACSVAEFPRIMVIQILNRKRVDSKVPAVEVFRENQFELKLVVAN